MVISPVIITLSPLMEISAALVMITLRMYKCKLFGIRVLVMHLLVISYHWNMNSKS